MPLAEIAERTGLHESSVRRILYDLAKRLAADPRTIGDELIEMRTARARGCRPNVHPPTDGLDPTLAGPGREPGLDPSSSLATQQVEEMVAAWRRGERPPAEDFLARYPELGDERRSG